MVSSLTERGAEVTLQAKVGHRGSGFGGPKRGPT